MDAMQVNEWRSRSLPIWLWMMAIAAIVLVFAFSCAMTQSIDRDEHQFVASGALWAREGLRPYGDYPYFHTPYLVYVYAAVFHLTDHLLLGARLVSCFAASALVFTIGLVAYRQLRAWPERWRRVGTLGAMLLLVANPVFAATSGRTWNHDVSTLLALLAFLAALRAIRCGTARDPRTATLWATGWGGLAGCLMGAAVGARLTFAPMACVLPILALVLGGTWRDRLPTAGAIAGGIVLALIPMALICLADGDQVWFGNMLYPRLNTLYRASLGQPFASSLPGKLLWTVGTVAWHPGCALLAGSAALGLQSVWGRRAIVHGRRMEMIAALMVTGALLIGTYAPAPLYLPYFFAELPFATLFVLYAVAGTPVEEVELVRRMRVLGAGVLVTSLVGITYYRHLFWVHAVERWEPMRIHALGERIASRIRTDGRVFTLAPILPLEGGRQIPPELVTGSFCYRVAGFVPAADRQRFKVIGGDDLPRLLAGGSIAAVVTGLEVSKAEPGLDSDINRIAKSSGYHLLELDARDKSLKCWVR